MRTKNFEVATIRAAWESISRMLLEEIARDPREPNINEANFPAFPRSKGLFPPTSLKKWPAADSFIFLITKPALRPIIPLEGAAL